VVTGLCILAVSIATIAEAAAAVAFSLLSEVKKRSTESNARLLVHYVLCTHA